MERTEQIRALRPGMRLANAVYLLEEKQVRTTKKGNPYLSARLRDATGRITAQFWDVPAGIVERLVAGQGVTVSGEVTAYQEQVQIRLDTIQPCPIDPGAFLPSSERSAIEMGEELDGYVAQVADPWLQQLLRRIFTDPRFRLFFLRAPGAKEYHHACLGGLAEHSLGVAAFVHLAVSHYPGLSVDLLLSGALLHDIGKVEAYQWETGLGLTDEGQLLDHIFMGAQRVAREIDDLPGFPQELRRNLLHLILSHHGEEAFGSPVRPKTMEAVALHLLDLLDARLRGFQDHLQRQASPEGTWTEWSKMFGTALYRGGNGLEQENGDEEALPFRAQDSGVPF